MIDRLETCETCFHPVHDGICPCVVWIDGQITPCPCNQPLTEEK